MKNLFEKFLSNSQYYYDDVSDCEAIDKLIENPDARNAERFILKYFEDGCKSKVFDTQFNAEFRSRGKHLHTVSLYMLGVELKEFAETHIERHLRSVISDDVDWYDFLHTWFLTSLYHDVGSVLEERNHQHVLDDRKNQIEYHLKQEEINHNVYTYFERKGIDNINTGIKKNAFNHTSSCFTYPEALIRRYFCYRAEKRCAVDHGIMAGYIMFDRLIKNYNEAWQFEKRRGKVKSTYDYFVNEKNRCWRIEHQLHFAIIANSIIAHNIWIGQPSDEILYHEYGLESIAASAGAKIRIEQWPLVFYLGILDTIEPVKRFKSIDPKVVWENINISVNGTSLVISNIGDVLRNSREHYECWLNGIYTISDWLDVDVKFQRNDQEVDMIILTPILEGN